MNSACELFKVLSPISKDVTSHIPFSLFTSPWPSSTFFRDIDHLVFHSQNQLIMLLSQCTLSFPLLGGLLVSLHHYTEWWIWRYILHWNAGPRVSISGRILSTSPLHPPPNFKQSSQHGVVRTIFLTKIVAVNFITEIKLSCMIINNAYH